MVAKFGKYWLKMVIAKHDSFRQLQNWQGKFLIIGWGLIISFLAVFSVSAKPPTIVEILTDDDYPPYSYQIGGKAQGSYVDLTRQAAEMLYPEYEVRFIALPWKRALKMVETGEGFAILPPYKYPNMRPYIFPYSVALTEEEMVTYCREGVDLEKAFDPMVKLPEPIRLGKNSGFIVLTEEHEKAIENNNLVLRENKSTEANVLKLLKGRLDCYVNDRLSTEYVLATKLRKDRSLAKQKIVLQERLAVRTVHIGYSKTNDVNFPYKADFVKKMNLAIEAVKQGKTSL